MRRWSGFPCREDDIFISAGRRIRGHQWRRKSLPLIFRIKSHSIVDVEDENRRNKKLGIDADHVDKAGKVHPV